MTLLVPANKPYVPPRRIAIPPAAPLLVAAPRKFTEIRGGSFEFDGFFCPRCKRNRMPEHWAHYGGRRNGRQGWCRECFVQYMKRREETEGYNREWHRRRMETDPDYRERQQLRSVVSGALKRGGWRKASSTYKILGCSWPEFMWWIDLHSGYSVYDRQELGLHYDHIVPMAWADTYHEAEQLNHFSNFNLIPARENLTKSAKPPHPDLLDRLSPHVLAIHNKYVQRYYPRAPETQLLSPGRT